MQVSSGSALIDVQKGAHKLNLPLVIASNTQMNLAGGTSLLVSDPVTVTAGKTLTQSGTGTVTYQSTLTLENTASVDLQHSGMMVQGGDYAAIESKVKEGFNGGDWQGNGITSSAAASDVRHATAVGIADNTAGDTLVKYTFYGDSDLTGVVDSGDFSHFLEGFDNASAARWRNGDYDYTGSVDLGDFTLFLAGLRGQGYCARSYTRG
jgi:hypothetical protein